MLRLVALTHRFGAHTALAAVSLHVRPGDCYGLLGHNGAGKSTALRIALGLLRPQRGTVWVDGFDARRHPVEARARLGGLIETPGFHGHTSGRDNLQLLGRLAGLTRAAARSEADRLLTLLGLTHAGARPVRAWSQGMRQRLGLAQALLGSPRCVVLDEPLNGLDPEGIAEMRALLRRLRGEGLTVLLSSHQLAEVAGLCNRIGIVRSGRLLVEDTTDALLRSGHQRYRVAAADPDALCRALADLGLRPTAGEADGVQVELGAAAAEDVLRRLVAAGVVPRAFAPDPPTLEEVYLAQPTPPTATTAVTPTVLAAAPSQRLAPPHGLRRAFAYELRRLTRVRGMTLLLAMPALLGGAAIVRRLLELRQDQADVARHGTFSATDVTGFEAMALALQAGVPLALAITAALASQSVAGELHAGTLRNVLLRPVARTQVALGKALALLCATAVAFGLVVAVAAATAAWWFDFGDVFELLPNGRRFPMVQAAALWPQLWRALGSPLLPLAATTGLGLLLGACTRGGASALATTLLLLLFGDLARGPLRSSGLAAWLPQAHLPSPLGDTSFLRAFAALTQGASDVTPPGPLPMMVVSLCWLLLTLVLTTWLLRRKSVP